MIHLKKKETDLDELILNLYKDLAEGVIDENDYKVLNKRYLSDKNQIQGEIKRVNEVVFRMRKWIDAFENLGEKLGKYLAESVDSQVMIDELVERVYVSKDGSIEIVFKCDDVIKDSSVWQVKRMKNIAIYLRLSLADTDLGENGKDESNSIENQRLLIRNYIIAHPNCW